MPAEEALRLDASERFRSIVLEFDKATIKINVRLVCPLRSGPP
jgi:hypothetical protein